MILPDKYRIKYNSSRDTSRADARVYEGWAGGRLTPIEGARMIETNNDLGCGTVSALQFVANAICLGYWGARAEYLNVIGLEISNTERKAYQECYGLPIADELILQYSMSISDDLLVNGLTVPKSKMDFGFVLKGLEKLSANGRLIAVLPHGVLFRGGKEETIRKWLIDNNLIKAVIGLPSNMFFNTQIPVFILVLERKNDNILFVDASKDFVKDGKFNRLESSHIEKILSVVKNNLEVKYYSHVATKAELQKNDYNLNIPRYIDLPPADPIDGVAVLNELIEIHQQQMDTAKDLSAMIKQLVPSTEENKMVINLTLKALDIEQR